MKILAIEASGQVCGAAVMDGDTLVADYNILYKKTHSQSLVPIMDEIRTMTELDLNTIDAVAVTKGPGSFTGIRIGAATAKGLCLALGKPVIPVPTVDALAYNLYGTGEDTLICPIMDARRSQVYTGIYQFIMDGTSTTSGAADGAVESTAAIESAQTGSDSTITVAATAADEPQQLTVIREQCVISIDEIAEALNESVLRDGSLTRRVIFLGDGVPVYRDRLAELMKVPYSFAPAHLARQRAGAAAALAMRYYRECGEACLENADDFRPEYLRLSQAERERASGIDTSKITKRD